MSALTKQQILERMKCEDICFTPQLDNFQLNSHSIDLRLGFTFLIPKAWRMTGAGREAITLDHLGENRKQFFDVIELEQGQYFDMLPGEFVIFSTLESFKIPNDLMGVLYPRSSVNRRGLAIDLTGIIDAGYEGQLTVPARNNTTGQVIRVYPGERFCQVVFEELSASVPTPRKSRYHKMDVSKGYISEKDSPESDLVIKGDIKKLKAEFPLKIEID